MPGCVLRGSTQLVKARRHHPRWSDANSAKPRCGSLNLKNNAKGAKPARHRFRPTVPHLEAGCKVTCQFFFLFFNLPINHEARTDCAFGLQIQKNLNDGGDEGFPRIPHLAEGSLLAA
jgi:hypothetical protein